MVMWHNCPFRKVVLYCAPCLLGFLCTHYYLPNDTIVGVNFPQRLDAQGLHAKELEVEGFDAKGLGLGFEAKVLDMVVKFSWRFRVRKCSLFVQSKPSYSNTQCLQVFCFLVPDVLDHF